MPDIKEEKEEEEEKREILDIKSELDHVKDKMSKLKYKYQSMRFGKEDRHEIELQFEKMNDEMNKLEEKCRPYMNSAKEKEYMSLSTKNIIRRLGWNFSAIEIKKAKNLPENTIIFPQQWTWITDCTLGSKLGVLWYDLELYGKEKRLQIKKQREREQRESEERKAKEVAERKVESEDDLYESS